MAAGLCAVALCSAVTERGRAAQQPRPQHAITAEEEASFEKAMRLLDAGNSAEAKPLLEALHRRLPGNYEVSESLGLLYASAGDLGAALPLLQSAARSAPAVAGVHANLGTAYLKLGKAPEAVSELQRAAALSAADTQTQNALGQALMLTKQPCKAADAFAEAQREAVPAGAAPEAAAPDADLAYNTALAYYDCGKPELARQQLSAMPGVDSSSPGQSLLGDINEKEKNYKEAADHYLRATQISPTETNVYAFGLDLLRHWSFDPAIKTFSTGLQAYPSSQRLLSGLGIAYYGAARYNDAIRTFSQLLSTDPENFLYSEIYGRSCTVLTDSEDPLCKDLTALAQKHPHNANLNLYAATAILHRPGDAQNQEVAQQLLQNALKSDPTLPDAHYELGVLLQQKSKWAESIQPLQAALAEDPNYARAHYRLGLAYSRTGRRQDAEKEMVLDRSEVQQQRNDLNARMQQITTLLVKMQ